MTIFTRHSFITSHAFVVRLEMMMTQTFGDPRRQVHKGSLLACVQVFVEQMQAKGYAAASVKISTRLVKDFAAWLDQRGVESHSLSAKHVADYLGDRWLQRRRRRGDAFTLQAFARLVAPDGYKASSGQEVAITPARRVRQRGNWGQSKIIIMRELVICTTAVLTVA